MMPILHESLILASDFHIPEDAIATCLNIRVEKVMSLLKSHTVTEAKNGKKAIKKAIVFIR